MEVIELNVMQNATMIKEWEKYDNTSNPKTPPVHEQMDPCWNKILPSMV